ncbi:TraM recognition domain-containing protein [[Ruminococcus] torques]|uniref:Cna protein B-type domain protein n=2 Tax=[Ruminococcus] torques TaxID=33039 RepID=A0A4V1Y9Y8_9FIRM|nr:TraM recognition domain-containing protein [[Ruminococcus] torques]RYS77857.1 hypothetical protein EAI93_11775 [[Ruminococcus] torques]
MKVSYPTPMEIDTFETDANGSFTLPEKLEYGSYYLHETKAPEGYLLGIEDIPFVVDQEFDWENPLSITYPDAPAKGKIRITKTDKETDKPIPEGAEFTVTAAEDITTPDGTIRTEKGTVVATLTTDEKGKAETEALYLGKYTIKETKAPNGYLVNPKEYEVTLKYKDQETEIVYGDVTVPDELAKGKIRVKKTDAETGNGLSNAEFEIRAKEDIVTPDGTVKVKAGTVVDTIKTDDKGSAETKVLYLGKYEVQETKAPEGYLLNTQKYPVELIYADQETEIVYGDVTVPDEIAKGKIRITKTDKETNKPIPSGAEFTVTAAEDITTPDGTVRAEKGTVVATLTTDDKGKAETDKLYLGKYVIKETKAPEGYLLNPKEFEVTLAYKDQTTEIVYGDVTVPDQPAKGKIRITKTDAETNKPIPSGAEFTVTAAEDITTPDGTVRAEKGTVVATLTTDDNMPPVDLMATMTTMGLGQNISFDLYLQNYEQLDDLYGESIAETIKGNCGNHFYLQTASKETASEFSYSLGIKSEIDMQRAGARFSLNKYYTESIKKRELLLPNELMQFEEGETAMFRRSKRRDLAGNSIKPRPIHNSRENGRNLWYFYQYAPKEKFPNPNEVNFLEVCKESRKEINLEDRIWDIRKSFQMMGIQLPVKIQDNLHTQKQTVHKEILKQTGNYLQICQMLKEVFGEHYEDEYGITGETTIAEYVGFIHSQAIGEGKKKILLQLV